VRRVGGGKEWWMPVLIHSAFFLSHLRNSLLFSLAPSCFSLALFFGEARERAREEACAKRSRRRKFSERLRRKEKAGLDFHPPSSSFFLFFFFFSFYFAMSDGKYFTTTKKGKLSTRSRRSVRDWIGARGRGRGRRSLRSSSSLSPSSLHRSIGEKNRWSRRLSLSLPSPPLLGTLSLSLSGVSGNSRVLVSSGRRERERWRPACAFLLLGGERARKHRPSGHEPFPLLFLLPSTSTSP